MMKTLSTIFLVISFLVLSGCTVSTIKPVTNEYCETFTPLEQSVFRYRMDKETYPHEIRINCFHQLVDESD